MKISNQIENEVIVHIFKTYFVRTSEMELKKNGKKDLNLTLKQNSNKFVTRTLIHKLTFFLLHLFKKNYGQFYSSYLTSHVLHSVYLYGTHCRLCSLIVCTSSPGYF